MYRISSLVFYFYFPIEKKKTMNMQVYYNNAKSQIPIANTTEELFVLGSDSNIDKK